MSNQLERLLFFIVVISGALCTVEDYVIMSQCAHNKAIHLAAAGTVSVIDISQIQNITIVGLPDYVNNEFKIALYAKETQRYLCFNDNWRLVGMRELRDTCYFNETIVHGYFVFRSVVDLQRRVGFTHRGKPVGPKKTVNNACYMFNKIDAEQFFHQHTLPKWREMAASQMMASNGNGSSNGRKPLPLPLPLPSRSNKNNRLKSNNQNQKLQPQQEHHGHNNNNSNIIINNSSNSLSSTNKRRLALNRQKQQQQQKQQQHQVRHHHNDPSLLARRQQHDKKQKRRRKEQLQQRVTASPTKRMTAAATAATTAATSTSATTTATKWSTATLSIKCKGRRRKGKPKAKPPPVTAATSTSSDDSLYSSSSSSSSSGMGYEDPYNASSTSITTLEPWPTWSTIDSFTPNFAGVSSSSSSSTTATSDDSISSSSNYHAWSTFITELESEASSATTTTTEMSGNDTELLLQYEAELVEDAETVSTTDYETKGTSAATAATAATTTSTAGTQLVIEQTPLQQELATTLASQTDLAPSTHKLSRHRGGGSGSDSKENHRQWLQGDNKLQQQQQHKLLLPLQPPTGSTRVPSATTPRRRLSLSTSTVERMTATPPQQHGLIDKIFSVYKNINSNLNNTLTEASPTVDTSRGGTVTAATTSPVTKKSLRKSTQKLMATPYHQLTYVRNEAGDIDIDNLDNISVYPDLFEGELDVSDSGNGNGSTSNSRLTFVSGYVATSPTSVLPESIRIAKIKINNERRRLQLHSQRRFA
ncbi:putative GPI-anchored protein pfl2 isoform X2 [Drosophila miranda]|uniref:putative GPI-anchored protein pfl2 isoform X2 n=1 Tax=Drosophila miranda TaxID=7229 RepID=UPI00143F4BC0|nr:putative GPI-anchored protein pfl2 isoform X2 [Drosophila miranda]